VSLSVALLVARAGDARVSLEEREGAKIAAADADKHTAALRQAEIVATWRKWYAEAIRSTTRLVVGPTSAQFAQRLDELAGPFEHPAVDRSESSSYARKEP
jgi:hypothetical protein